MDVDDQMAFTELVLSLVSVPRSMTPAEMRDVLLDEARWWANQPAHAGSAHPWVTFFEQLPEDDQMLVMLSGMYQDANAFRNRSRDRGVNQFSTWNMTCRIFEKLSKMPPPPDRGSDTREGRPEALRSLALAHPPTFLGRVGACRERRHEREPR
jgi:hypothetical protein